MSTLELPQPSANLIRFTLTGRFAHFAHAVSQMDIPTYPVPPRTVILGLAGAILGLDRTQTPIILASANISVGGAVAATHWHRGLFRNFPQDHETKRVRQEWLVSPRYTIWLSLPNPYHDELADRLLTRRWHFTPYLGISEMLADLQNVTIVPSVVLPNGEYPVCSIIPAAVGNIDRRAAVRDHYALRLETLPRSVSPDRDFTHERYWIEAYGRPVMTRSEHAIKVGKEVILFL